MPVLWVQSHPPGECGEDVDSVGEGGSLGPGWRDSLTEVHPSVLTDHVMCDGHTVSWDGVRLNMGRDHQRGRRSVSIGRTGSNAMNCDGALPQVSGIRTILVYSQC